MDITQFIDGIKLALNVKLVFVVVIATSVLLFTPNELLTQLGLADTQAFWRPWIGGVWVLASAGLLVHLGSWIVGRYSASRERRRGLERLHNLGAGEKELLRTYFAKDTHSLQVDVQSDIALTLRSCGILRFCSTPNGVLMGAPGSHTIRGTFALTEDAWHYLKKHPELLEGGQRTVAEA